MALREQRRHRRCAASGGGALKTEAVATLCRRRQWRCCASGDGGVLQAAAATALCRRRRRRRFAASDGGGAVQAATTAAFCRQRWRRRCAGSVGSRLPASGSGTAPPTSEPTEPAVSDADESDGSSAADAGDLSNDENVPAEEAAAGVSGDDMSQHPRYNDFGASGASKFSSASRILDEREAKAYEVRKRTKRPSHRQYSDALLDPCAVQVVIVGRHKCRNQWSYAGQMFSCHQMLYAQEPADAIEKLRQQRE
eukprot:5619480-Pleurochrysis_carterae.AAC.1